MTIHTKGSQVTLDALLAFAKENRASVRISCETPGIVTVFIGGMVVGGTCRRFGDAEADRFEDAFELARIKFENWRIP